MITIATLKASGLSADQIVAVLEASEADQLRAAEAKREKNRDRMRASRAAHIAHDDAQPARDAHDSALSILPSSLSESQQPKKEKEVKKERAKRDRGQVCPDDFRPAEVHFAAGQRVNISRPRVEVCCEAMKSWSKSNAHRAVARKSDWHAALFGWIDRESERTSGKPNGTNGHGRTILEAADDLIDTLRGFDQPAPGDLLGPARPPDARLLPKG